jgi:glycosyltransferase involved in cell wall biosynthesis
VDNRGAVDVLDCFAPLGFDALEKRWLKFHVVQALRASRRLHRYDVVLSHGWQSGFMLALVRALLGKVRPPHVVIDVGCITGGRTNLILVKVCRAALRSVAALVYHAKAHKEFYDSYFPELADRAHYVPLGVNTADFRPLYLPEDDYFVCPGYAKRDWDLLLEAYRGLRTRLKLVLLGAAGKVRADLPGVVVLPKSDLESMKACIARSRFVVLPLPLIPYSAGQQTLLQAMPMGKAVVVSDIPALRDYVRDGATALICRAGDATDLRDKLALLLQRPALRKRLGAAARREVEERFSEEEMAQRICAILERVVREGVSATRGARASLCA